MDEDLNVRSRTMDAVELGRRLRAARMAAGMTQNQVAGDDVSGAYISRIEDGQRRPEIALLNRMLARMGTTLTDLLGEPRDDELIALQVKLDYAELALSSGDVSDALQRVDDLLAELPASGASSSLVRPARQVRAAALEAMGELTEAIVLLEDLTRDATPDAAWLKDLIALSRCHRETGDLARAIDVGAQAQDQIESLGLRGVREAIQLTVTIAGAYLLKGDLEQAMSLCRRAMDDADEVGSLEAKAAAYWNASAIEARNGAHRSALDLARKALACFEVGEDVRNLARLRTQVAKMQLRQDPPDAAGALETLRLADRELAWSPASSLDHASQELTRARAAAMLDDIDGAQDALRSALAVVPPEGIVVRASALAFAGQLALMVGDTKSARQKFQSAVQDLTSVGADREAAQLWFELGGMLGEVGDVEGALDAFRRAGASTGLSLAPQTFTRAGRPQT